LREGNNMTEWLKIVVELDFNYPEDSTEFGGNDRVMRLNRFPDSEEGEKVALSFELGRKEDDTITLSLPYSELLAKLKDLSPGH